MNLRITNLNGRLYSTFGALISNSRKSRPLMSMTMHEWSELVLDVKAKRNSIFASTKSAGVMKMTLDVYAELSKDGAQPNIQAFNRLLKSMSIEHADDIFGQPEIDDDSRFQQNMALLGCIEQEPLNLKPNQETFEIAMSNLFSRPRMATLTEALFQLMQTPAYGFEPTRLCWLFRVAAVMSRTSFSAADQYYAEFTKRYSLDRSTATMLIRAAILRLCWDFLYNRLLPDIQAASKEFVLDEGNLVRVLTWQSVCSSRGVPLIRWALRTNALDKDSPLYFTEPLCIRWLTWLSASDIGSGVSDIAEAAMQRIIDLRSGGTVPRRLLEMYLQVMEVEESGIPGELARFQPECCLPITPSALGLAARIKRQLRVYAEDNRGQLSISN